MFRKRTALVLMLLVVGAFACGDDGDSPPTADEPGGDTEPAGLELDGKEVAFINSGVNEFSTCFLGGLEEGFEGTGVAVTNFDSRFEPARQQANVEDAIASGVDGAVLVGLASELSANSLQAFEAAGVPVVLMYEPAPDGTSPTAVFFVDLFKLGDDTVEAMTDHFPDARRIGMITGVPGLVASDIPEARVEENLSKLDGVELVGSISGMFNRDEAAAATEDMIQANPDVEVLIVFSDEMGQAAERVLAGAGRDDVGIGVVSLYSNAGYEAVEEGTFGFAMGLPAASIGIDTADLLTRAMQGEIPGVQEYDLPVLDADNISDAPVGCL